MAQSTYVLVPGAGGGAAMWRLVAEELERRGHEAIPVDLPADDEEAGLTEYADLLVAAAAERSHVVLVGQSMGAYPATMAAARIPGSQLVLLNAMVPAPGESPGEWWDAVGFTQAKRDNDIREGRDPDADVDLAVYFTHDTPPELIPELEASSTNEAEIAFTTPLPLDAWPDVPTHVIAGRDDRFFPLDLQRRVARERLGIEPDVVPGGHMLAMSHPVELVDLLESYDIVAVTPDAEGE